MKPKKHAKDAREELARQRKGQWSQGTSASRSPVPAPSETVRKRIVLPAAECPSKTPEEETREFLDYLEKENFRFSKEEAAVLSRKPKIKKALVGIVNLEDGMPTVEEALADLRISLQSMRSGGLRIVKLIHGYGSTGRGGKICIGVRNELAAMARKRLIRDYVTGEDFGPYSETSRRIADQYRDITRDPDYGKCNHGITVVVL